MIKIVYSHIVGLIPHSLLRVRKCFYNLMPRWLAPWLFTSIVFALVACNTQHVSDQKLPGKQVDKEFKGELELNYLLYLPDNYTEDKEPLPLILFLHGAGERGDSLNLVKAWGPPKIVEEKGLPFIVVSPQCPKSEYWTSLVYSLKQLLDQVIEEYNVDTNRIYLTGLSMGGYGTFAMSQVYPEYFAAIAPICGGGTPSLSKFSKALPTWVFHGDKDQVVPLKASQIMVDAIKAKGGEVKFTVYRGVDHFSWIPAYNESGLFEWFLEHSK